jgi:large subunit ribosomal protein L17
MRHKDARHRLKQKPAHARMLKRNLLTSLILYENIRTTKVRAKAISAMFDRLIRNAKLQEPHTAIRAINQIVTDKNACRKVMEVLVKRYAKRPSGLTRIKAVGARKGDNADLVDFSLVDSDVTAVSTSSDSSQV